MTPGAGAAAIAAAVLDPDEARFFGDEIVAAAAETGTDADAAPPPTLAQLAARFNRAFPPGHARFCACSAAALTLEATRRAPRAGGALDPGQRAALWFCVRAAFFEGDGEGDGRSDSLALNPFLPLMLRAVASSSSSSSLTPEKAYLLRMLASPPPSLPADDGKEGDGEAAPPPRPAPLLYADLPPSAAVAKVEAESASEQCNDIEALCERWRQAAAAELQRRRQGPPLPLLQAVPWQRPLPRPLPPVPGELRWLYPPLPVEQQGQGQPQQQASPSLFLWDGAMGAEDDDEEEEREEDEGGGDKKEQQTQPPKRTPPPPLTLDEARDLVARALRGPLPPSQQQRVLAALEADATRRRQRRRHKTTTSNRPLVARLGVEPEHVPLLVEHVPNLAHGLLVASAAARPRSARGRELLAALARATPVTVSSLEVVHRLSSSSAPAGAQYPVMPRSLLRAYVARCLEACEQLAGEGGGGGLGGAAAASGSSSASSLDSAAARLVRLVCVFLTALVKSGGLWREVGAEEEEEAEEQLLSSSPGPAATPLPPQDDGDPLLHQLRAWCVSMSRVREAAALFQLLQAGS